MTWRDVTWRDVTWRDVNFYLKIKKKTHFFGFSPVNWCSFFKIQFFEKRTPIYGRKSIFFRATFIWKSRKKHTDFSQQIGVRFLKYNFSKNPHQFTDGNPIFLEQLLFENQEQNALFRILPRKFVCVFENTIFEKTHTNLRTEIQKSAFATLHIRKYRLTPI